MLYKYSSLQPVIECFVDGKPLSPSEVSIMLSKSKVLIHRYLKALVGQGILKKLGSGTHVTYVLANPANPTSAPLDGESSSLTVSSVLPYAEREVIDQSFYKFAANGMLRE